MIFNFRLPMGNKAQVGSITLNSNGKVDPQEGRLPAQGISEIQDQRVESFVRNHSADDLGKAWQGRLPDKETGEIVAVISGNFGETQPTIASQILIVDPQANRVTVQTQDADGPFFNHWIQANYDPNSGKVNPETITEWVD